MGDNRQRGLQIHEVRLIGPDGRQIGRLGESLLQRLLVVELEDGNTVILARDAKHLRDGAMSVHRMILHIADQMPLEFRAGLNQRPVGIAPVVRELARGEAGLAANADDQRGHTISLP